MNIKLVEQFDKPERLSSGLECLQSVLLQQK